MHLRALSSITVLASVAVCNSQPGNLGTSLGDGLPQPKTNGKSHLGTLGASRLSEHDYPRTGVIRSYDFTIGRDFLSPDGYSRPVILINGQFPGPLIEANWGDTIQVSVHNNITSPGEGTTLHWHGLSQAGTPWQDGVPGVSQCPIPPTKSFTYSFIADRYGTSWYHSHFSAQRVDGVFGPLIIHGPNREGYDIDIGPVILSDWYHESYTSLVQKKMSPNTPTFQSDNNLINGKMRYNCSRLPEHDTTACDDNAALSKFKFARGKIHRLRLVNTGAEALQHFSIDEHQMTVIAHDFVPVEPYETNIVTLAVGQRADVLVKATGQRDAYWMRSDISISCSEAKQIHAFAAIYYDTADISQTPNTTPWHILDKKTCATRDLENAVPLTKLPLPEPDLQLEMDLDTYKNASNITLQRIGGVIGGDTSRVNYNSPTLLLSNLGNFSFENEWNVRNTWNRKSVRLILTNITPEAHPLYLHGLNMYVVAVGTGRWDGNIVRRSNPMRRDTVQVQPNAYVVLQFDAAENPGVWPLLSSNAWQSSAGCVMQFLTSPQSIRALRIPQTAAQTCRQWGRSPKPLPQTKSVAGCSEVYIGATGSVTITMNDEELNRHQVA